MLSEPPQQFGPVGLLNAPKTGVVLKDGHGLTAVLIRLKICSAILLYCLFLYFS